MKKTNAFWTFNNLVFLIFFNAVFFIAGGVDHVASVWVSYGFVHFAYLMLLLTPKFIRAGSSSAVFGFSLFTISATYFFIELVVGIIFILAAPEGYKTAAVIQMCFAGLYGAMLIPNMIANEHTAEAEEKRQPEIDYIKNASIKLKLLLDQVKDREAKRQVERVYDALDSSPVKSYPDLAQIEKDMLQLISNLEHAIAAGNNETIISSANSLLTAVNERNMRLKALH